MTKRVLPLLVAIAMSLFSLCSVEAQYNNSAGNPLRSVLPGVGTTVGIDLEKELLSGTVLPVVNGGTGGSISFPLSVSNGGTGATTLTAKGIIFGNGTSAVGITAAGSAGIPLIGAVAATDTIYAEYSAGTQTQDAIAVGVVIEYQPSDF